MMVKNLPRLLKRTNINSTMKLFASTKNSERMLKPLRFFLRNKTTLREPKLALKKLTSQKSGLN